MCIGNGIIYDWSPYSTSLLYSSMCRQNWHLLFSIWGCNETTPTTEARIGVSLSRHHRYCPWTAIFITVILRISLGKIRGMVTNIACSKIAQPTLKNTSLRYFSHQKRNRSKFFFVWGLTRAYPVTGCRGMSMFREALRNTISQRDAHNIPRVVPPIRTPGLCYLATTISSTSNRESLSLRVHLLPTLPRRVVT